MGKISDIWVRLGLKKEGFDKGMDDAGKKAESFGDRLGKMKAGALAVWAAIGTAVMKFAQDLIASTNRMGDNWAVFTSRSKAAWDTFLSAVSSWDFNNFFARMSAATSEAAKFAAAMDSEFEAENSVRLQRSAMAAELAALKVQMQDATKSYDERIQAAKDYIAKVSPLYDQIVAQAKKMEDAHLGKWLAGTNLQDNQQTREDLRKFLVALGKDADLYSILDQYSKAQRTIDKGVNAWGSNYGKINKAYDARAAVAKTIAEIQQEYGTDIIEMFRAYNDMRGDKDTRPLVEAMIRAGEAASMKDVETQEMQSVTNGLIQQKTAATLAIFAKAVDPHKVASDLIKQLNKDYMDVNRELGAMIDPETFFADIDMSDVDNDMAIFLDNWRANVDEIVALNDMLEQSFVSSMSGGLQALTDMMMGIEGANASRVLSALLEPFADTAIQLGELLVAKGMAIDTLKTAFTTLQGAPAIAAGAALIALGSAMKSGIKALANGPQGATSATTGVASSAGEAQLYESEITINVVGKISGSDIILAGEKTLNKWNR